jgi:hypothetical protein
MGRNTSARSTSPSLKGTGTSKSMRMPSRISERIGEDAFIAIS